MSEVEIITEQITYLAQQRTEKGIVIVLSIFGMLIGGIVGSIILMNDKRDAYRVFGIGLIGLAVFSGVFFSLESLDHNERMNKMDDLEEKRSELIKNNIMKLSCDELRLDIIDKLENEYPYYIKDFNEFEKDYYYHKCEIPLREEVMKLK